MGISEQYSDVLWAAAQREARHFQLPADWAAGRPRVDGVAIDDASTQDRDDAILRLPSDDGFQIYTSIASVAEFVGPDSAIARHAEYLGETRYIRSAPRPMMPRIVGERTLGLSSDRDAPALTQVVSLDNNFEVAGDPVYSRTIISPLVVAYEAVAEMTHNKGLAEGTNLFRQYEAFALNLLRGRQGRGALAYYNAEQGLMTNEDGHLVAFEAGVEHSGQLIVQEFMILRNALTGLFMLQNEIPGVFRRHRMMRTIDVAGAVAILQEEGREGLARAMSGIGRAQYDTEPGPHDALGIPVYAQDSSPLRRFGDQVNQANILAFLDGRPYPYQGGRLHNVVARLNEVREELHGPSPYLKGKDQRVSDWRLQQPVGVLLELGSPDFYRVTKAAVRTGRVPDGFREAVGAKLQEAVLPGEDIATLLFAPHASAEWTELKTLLLTFLAANLGTSAHVLSIAGAQRMVDGIREVPLPAAGSYNYRTDITLGEEVFSGEGSHQSSNGARHRAGLRAMGVAIGVDVIVPDDMLPAPPSSGAHAKNMVNTHVQRQGHPTPAYTTQELYSDGTTHLYESKVTVDGVEYTGHGGTKKAAEADAAGHAATALNLVPSEPAEKGETAGQTNPISFLHERSQRLALPSPQYRTKQTGPPHDPTFTVTVIVPMPEGEPMEYAASGKSKAAARLQASKHAQDALG